MAECLGDARKAAGCEMCYVRKTGPRKGRRSCRKPQKNWIENNRDRFNAASLRYYHKPFGGYYTRRKRQLAQQRASILEQLGGLDDS